MALEVFVLEHSTKYLPETGVQRFKIGKPTPYLKNLFITLKSRGITSAGIEEYASDPLPPGLRKDPVLRYWRGAYLNSMRAGVELVPLAASPADRALVWLHVAVLTARRKNVSNVSEWNEHIRTLPINPYFKAPEGTRSLAKKVGELIKITPETLKKLELALYRCRSLRMQKRAEDAGLGHALLGSIHALDLALDGSATLGGIFSEDPAVTTPERQKTGYEERRVAHSRLWKTLRELERKAEKLNPRT